jgi:hypothetical protein
MANIKGRVKKLEAARRAAPGRVLTLAGPAGASNEEIEELARQKYPDRSEKDLVVYVQEFGDCHLPERK